MKLTLALLFAATLIMAADEPPAVGTKAPNFKLSSQEGTQVSLHDYLGNGWSCISIRRI